MGPAPPTRPGSGTSARPREPALSNSSGLVHLIDQRLNLSRARLVRAPWFWLALTYVAFSAQVIFTALSFLISRGTFG